MLSFHCEQCEIDFESEPDASGYEQAACPRCRELAMTHAFLAAERERNRLPTRFSLRTMLYLAAVVAVILASATNAQGNRGDATFNLLILLLVLILATQAGRWIEGKMVDRQAHREQDDVN